MRATKVNEGENSHAKNYSHGGKRPSGLRGSRKRERYIYIYREREREREKERKRKRKERAQKRKITYSRYFGRRAMKIKS